MVIKDFLDGLDEEVKIINSSDFDIEVTTVNKVPNDSDSNLTFENFDLKSKKVKTIETCVLFVDIRKSTTLNISHYPKTLAKLYSSFIRSMIKAAEYYNGKIRNIVGDRLMVVFDPDNCFTEAVNTAILMNTITQQIIDKRFDKNTFKCGIGIDFGKMMVVKCGTIKQRVENADYKSLVWLGQPANIASKLTDIANKPSTNRSVSGVNVGLRYPLTDKWVWQFKTPSELTKNIIFSRISPDMRYNDQYFSAFHASSKTESNYDSTKPILITESVYNGYKKVNQSESSILNNWWSRMNKEVNDYNGKVYQSDVTFTWK